MMERHKLVIKLYLNYFSTGGHTKSFKACQKTSRETSAILQGKYIVMIRLNPIFALNNVIEKLIYY